jgi:hypothetical protein
MPFTTHQIQVGILPPPLGCAVRKTKALYEYKPFFSDHLDRVGCLLEGRDGMLHLVVDPQMCSIEWFGGTTLPWKIRGPEETFEELKVICNKLHITLCSPSKLVVPYTLNLEQFSDGRVLMTSGDNEVKELIGGIVGEENIFETPLPIRFLPVYQNAGIRCLINKAPTPLLKHLPEKQLDTQVSK